jgi:TM2 domain-containing membrane protein YozV
MKNPALAAVLSIISGLGQIYNGQLAKGIMFFVGAFIGWFLLVVPGIIIGVLSMVDAYKTAQKINSQHKTS